MRCGSGVRSSNRPGSIDSPQSVSVVLCDVMYSLWSLLSTQHRQVYDEKHAKHDGKKAELVPVIDASRAVSPLSSLLLRRRSALLAWEGSDLALCILARGGGRSDGLRRCF